MCAHIWTAGLLTTLALTCSVASGQSVKETHSDTAEGEPGGEQPNKPDLDRVRDGIVTRTNRFRTEQGRKPLTVHRALSKAAQDFAEFMARTDKYGHTADGKEPWERCVNHGYQYAIILENIGWEYNSAGFTTDDLARAFVEAWKESPPHRKNLLDPDVRDLGVGVAFSKRTGRYYAVQDYGRPKADMVEFKINNRTDTPINYLVDGKKFVINPRYTITHERSRPPELKFRWPDQARKTTSARETFHPSQGTRYVIKKDGDGAFNVVRE